MKTRERIKLAAVDMFNEKAATNVSTVQLSEKLKISPGNLYYYFDNKEHLIRDIWTEDIITHVDMLFFREDFGHSENGILNFFDDYSKVIYKYRFFYSEAYALLKNDSEMTGLYVERLKKLKEQLVKVMTSWEETGIMNEISLDTKKLLIDNIWMIGQTWSSFSEMDNRALSPEEISKDTVIHVYALLAPYFTKSAKERIFVLLNKKGMVEHMDLKETDL